MKKLSFVFALLVSASSFAITERESEILDRYTGYYKVIPNLFTLPVPKLKPFDDCLEGRYDGGVLEVTRGDISLKFKSTYQWMEAPFREIDKVTQTRLRATNFYKSTNGPDRQTVLNGDKLKTELRAYSYETYSITDTAIFSKSADVSRTLIRFEDVTTKNLHTLNSNDQILTTRFDGHRGPWYTVKCEYERISKSEYDQMLMDLNSKHLENKQAREDSSK